MKKLFSCIVVLAVALLLATPSFAGNKNDLAYKSLDELDSVSTVLATDGVILSQGSVPKQGMTVSDLSKVDVASVRVKTTTRNTTVLATETGKTFIAKYDTKFQLPAAADGLTYTFVSGANVEIEIQVSTTPSTIVMLDADAYNNGVIETSGTTTANTTGTTVTLVSDGTDWYAISQWGTLDGSSNFGWETGGEWIAFTAGENE